MASNEADGRLDRPGILARLAAGEVVILQTDTLPGLHARLDRPAALAALNELKGRPGRPLLVIAASPSAARSLAGPLAPAVADFAAACWPGPFTLVLPAAGGLPAEVVAPEGTVAVRVPDLPPLCALLADCGPLASTSVNLAGQPPAPDLAAAARTFPQLAVWAESPDAGAGSASALVDLTGARPRLLRPGPRPLPAWPADR